MAGPMREDDMLKLSLDCAQLAVRGDDFATALVAGADRVMRADAGTVLVSIPLGSRMDKAASPRVVAAGIPPADDAYIATAVELSPRHPYFTRTSWYDSPSSRISDLVDLGRFWETDVWVRMHGHVNGRFAAGANRAATTGSSACCVCSAHTATSLMTTWRCST